MQVDWMIVVSRQVNSISLIDWGGPIGRSKMVALTRFYWRKKKGGNGMVQLAEFKISTLKELHFVI